MKEKMFRAACVNGPLKVELLQIFWALQPGAVIYQLSPEKTTYCEDNDVKQ